MSTRRPIGPANAGRSSSSSRPISNRTSWRSVLVKFRRGSDRERDPLADLSRSGRDADPPFHILNQQERFELKGRDGRTIRSARGQGLGADARLSDREVRRSVRESMDASGRLSIAVVPVRVESTDRVPVAHRSGLPLPSRWSSARRNSIGWKRSCHARNAVAHATAGTAGVSRRPGRMQTLSVLRRDV